MIGCATVVMSGDLGDMCARKEDFIIEDAESTEKKREKRGKRQRALEC